MQLNEEEKAILLVQFVKRIFRKWPPNYMVENPQDFLLHTCDDWKKELGDVNYQNLDESLNRYCRESEFSPRTKRILELLVDIQLEEKNAHHEENLIVYRSQSKIDDDLVRSFRDYLRSHIPALKFSSWFEGYMPPLKNDMEQQEREKCVFRVSKEDKGTVVLMMCSDFFAKYVQEHFYKEMEEAVENAGCHGYIIAGRRSNRSQGGEAYFKHEYYKYGKASQQEIDSMIRESQEKNQYTWR